MMDESVGRRVGRVLGLVVGLYEPAFDGGDERAIELAWFAVEGLLSALVVGGSEDIGWALDGLAAVEREYPAVGVEVGASRAWVHTLSVESVSSWGSWEHYRAAVKSLSSVTRVWRRRARGGMRTEQEPRLILALWKVLANAADALEPIEASELVDRLQVVGAPLQNVDSQYARYFTR